MKIVEGLHPQYLMVEKPSIVNRLGSLVAEAAIRGAEWVSEKVDPFVAPVEEKEPVNDRPFKNLGKAR